MKLQELLQYVTERGAAFVITDGRLELQHHKKLTERLRIVLMNRRAEIYQHFRLQMPEPDRAVIEQCPHCEKKFFEKGIDDNGQF